MATKPTRTPEPTTLQPHPCPAPGAPLGPGVLLVGLNLELAAGVLIAWLGARRRKAKRRRPPWGSAPAKRAASSRKAPHPPRRR
ncbi:MAG TPA: hypothetical protein VFS43_13250 [Polyangiaceae bacterium]|nr:hypothetical protein [Polyangiaceae bacterium]